MRMIGPRTGHEEITVAEDQLQYLPITVNRFTQADGSVIILTRWQPTPDERQRIANGEDLYVGQLNFGGGMTPMMVNVGVPSYVPPVID